MNDSDFTIQSFRGGYDKNLSYLVTCLKTGTQFLVDAAISFDKIRPAVRNRISHVLITHAHSDHLLALNEVVETFPDTIIVTYTDSVAKFKTGRIKPVGDNSCIAIGNLQIEIIHTPGHSHDSLCYKLANVIFTGDTLFVGRTGRTVSTGSDVIELYRSVYGKLLTLSQSTIVYPGHDYGSKPIISLKENIQISPLLQAQNEKDFVRRMAEFETHRLK